MIEEGDFWDTPYEMEYKPDYGNYKVLSRTVEIDQILIGTQKNRNEISLFKDNKFIASVKNAELEAKRGVGSVFSRRLTPLKEKITIVNFDKEIYCRVINPTHGRVATRSGDNRLICGSKDDVSMTESDWESEKRSRWF